MLTARVKPRIQYQAPEGAGVGPGDEVAMSTTRARGRGIQSVGKISLGQANRFCRGRTTLWTSQGPSGVSSKVL